MSPRIPLVRRLLSRLSPQAVLDLTGKVGREWLRRLPVEERAAFLGRLIEENLSAALEGLGREERAALMNGLLPVIARHFPLEDVDILGTLGNVEIPQQPDREETPRSHAHTTHE
ncbi:MAG: hypothetical protein U9R05_08495 [Chloroflexota bacterium]|nr:hypothetical protein [Chloroflexota bacterium]